MLAPLVALALSAAPWRADAPKTHEIDLPRFQIQSTDHALGMANLLAAELEQDRDFVAARLGGDWPGATEVRIGDGVDEVLRLDLPAETPPPWAAGLAHPAEALVLFDAGALRAPGAPGIVRHELAHLAIAQLGGNELPRWLQEGLAIHAAGESSPESSLSLLRASREPIPLAELERAFPDNYSDVSLAYAESQDFVDYLIDHGGMPALRKLLEAVRGGVPFDSAFTATYGAPRSSLEAAWLKQLTVHYKWVPLVTGSSAVFTLTALLCIAAWARVRRRKKTRVAEMALEEQALQAAQRIRAAEESMPQPGAAEPPAAAQTKPTLH